jgi:hypothetical protein
MKTHYRVELVTPANADPLRLARKYLPEKFGSEDLAFRAMAEIHKSFIIWLVTSGDFRDQDGDAYLAEKWTLAASYEVRSGKERS